MLSDIENQNKQNLDAFYIILYLRNFTRFFVFKKGFSRGRINRNNVFEKS